MPRKKKVEVDSKIQEKLEYIGLDLEKIPKSLKEYSDINFRTLKGYDEKKYQLSSQTVDIIEITSDLHRHEGVDQEYTAVYFLTTKCRGLHVCSMKLGTYMFHLTFV